MWLFSSPKNYGEMLKKIATTMFFISLFAIMLLTNLIAGMNDFMNSISLGIKYEFNGFYLYISYFYFPLLFATLENILKLHNIVSNIFSIRYNFDRKIIISCFMQKLKINKIGRVNKNNREVVMNNIFYKYASSTSPKIDRHLIDMALNVWSWYWILLDTIICLILIGISMMSYAFDWQSLFILLCIVGVLMILMSIIKMTQCKKYALLEVDEILSDKMRKAEVNRYLTNAL